MSIVTSCSYQSQAVVAVLVHLDCFENQVLIQLPSPGSHTMALLEKLEPGSVYLVKISAANQVGDGPFSQIVELAPKHGTTHRSKNPRHSSPDTAGTMEATSANAVNHTALLFKVDLGFLSWAGFAVEVICYLDYHI